MVIQVCLRRLEHGQIDRQTESINTFRVCWKVLKKIYVIQLPSLFYILQFERLKADTKKY